MNSDSKNKQPPTTEEGTAADNKEGLSTESPLSSTSHASKSTGGGDTPPPPPRAPLKGLVDSVDNTIQGVRSKVKPQDLLYYFAFVATFGLLVVGPFAARHMRRSDTNYDDLDPEDPIADLATFVRTEFLKNKNGDDNYYERGPAGSTMGGLDTLLADLLRSPQIQNAINELVNNILTSPQFKQSCSILIKELWKDLVEDSETLKQVIHLLYNAIQDEAIKDAAVQLVTEVFADKEVLDEVVELFQRLGQEAKVQKATEELLVESAHNALNDPEILDHSMEFATDVVGDDVVQQTAGEALYNTLSYAVRPTLSVFLAILGTGLMFVSLMAFQHSIAPESQSQSLDRALTNLEKSGLIQGLIKLVTFPWHVVVACKEALMWLFMLPIRLVSGTLTGLGRAGNATVDTLNRCIRWILNIPIQLAQSILGAIGSGLVAMSDGLARQSRQLAQAWSGSFFGVFFHRMAEGLTATTRGFRLAWVVSNEVMASGSLAVEAFWYKTLQVLEQGAAKTIVGWVATKSTVVTASKAIRAGWISTNRAVENAALVIEEYLKNSCRFVMQSMEQLEVRAAGVGLTRRSVWDASERTKETLVVAYHRLDRAAARLGFYFEDVLGKLASKIKDLRGATTPRPDAI